MFSPYKCETGTEDKIKVCTVLSQERKGDSPRWSPTCSSQKLVIRALRRFPAATSPARYRRLGIERTQPRSGESFMGVCEPGRTVDYDAAVFQERHWRKMGKGRRGNEQLPSSAAAPGRHTTVITGERLFHLAAEREWNTLPWIGRAFFHKIELEADSK
ncbi:unnamed protein product [Nesidiocoris tenuis]|uniref:Uncharacterized protein n=1 Tax=Nesidiocoris tenuis TaxID=355587 RepID=A0A6H5GFH7_9HEMI|nr:unnamed protein product [Nesidiocoris tenuis]